LILILIIIIKIYVISLQVYKFLRKSLDLWLLTSWWNHAKIMSKTKKCWTYVKHETHHL